MLHATLYQRRAAFDAIKRLMNECRMAVVVLGNDVERALRTDPHLNARFRYRSLPVWRVDDAFRGLLMALEKTLPLRKPSHLERLCVMRELIALSEGSLTKIMLCVVHAAVLAIRAGTERIEIADIKKAATTLPQGCVETWSKAA